MSDLLSALVQLGSPVQLAFMLLGVASGIFFGAVPGLTGGMLIALTLPLTYTMDSTNALVLLVSMYVGGVSGGLITAILLRMPGSPSSVMTTLDGYPMAAAGRPGRALALSIGASLAGGLLAGVVLVVLSPPLSRWATTFGPWEYFAMVLMALVLMAAVTQGSLVKGLISGFLGMLFAMPGLNSSDGQLRLTWGFEELDAGLQLLPVLLGVFVVSQVLSEALNIGKTPTSIELGDDQVKMPLREWRAHVPNILRSSAIGTWIGILPGVGASIASMVAYAAERSLSKTPEKFGTGSEEGIVAAEAANNANVGGSLVPLVTMGIPGSPIDAILIGALIVHNIQPGPLLFVTHGGLVWSIIASYLVANIVMFFMMTYSVRWLARVMYIKRAYLLPTIFVMCIIGAFSIANHIFDMWVVLVFGVIGFGLERAKMPLGPFVIGFVLEGLFEEKLRSGLQASGNSYMVLLDRPIALVLLVITVALLVYSLLVEMRTRRRADAAEPAE